MTNEQDLISNLKCHYDGSLRVLSEFGGPSIYFHVQCIKEQSSNFLSERHVELIYATLASWGMHRMGDPTKTKAKLREYREFHDSIIDNKKLLQKYASKRFSEVSPTEYEKMLYRMRDLYFDLKVSVSNSTIVANSKTLAHILPDFIPPIDRQYTIRFFTQNRNNFFTKKGKYSTIQLPADSEAQFECFVEICVRIKRLFDKANASLFKLDSETFNTSYPKIIDNIIMSYVKSVEAPVQ